MSIGPVELEFVLKDVNFKAGAKKLEDGIKGVSSTTKEETAKMSSAMGDFASLSAKQMKESIAIQKQAIKDLQLEIKKLEQESKGLTGKKLDANSSLISNAKRNLAGEQIALMQMQKAQVAQNATEAASQNPIIAGLSKWAIGLVTVGAAMKIGKAIIDSTEATHHKYEQAVEAAKSATNYFFKAIASGDWSNFFEGMEKAVKGAIEYVDAMEKIENKRNEEKIRSSKYDIEIGRNRALTFDKESGNDAERKRAYEEILRLSKLQFDEKTAIARLEYNANLEKAASDSKLSKERIEQFLTEYTSLEKMLELGEKYNKLASQRNAQKVSPNMFTHDANISGYGELDKQISLLPPGAAEAGKYVTQISRVIPETRKQLAGLAAAQNELQAGFDMSNFRIKTGLAALINKQAQEAQEAAKKAIDEQNKKTKAQLDYDTEIGRQRIANQIEIEQQSLNLQKDSAEKSRKQAELDYRKTLVEIANQKADQLKKLNEVSGGIDEKTGKPTAAYISELPEADQKQIDEKVVLATETKNAKIVEINKKAAEDIQKIWQEVNDYRLTGMDKELAAVKKKFDDELKLAKAAGDEKLQTAIEERRGAANAEIKQKYAIEELDFQKEIEFQKNEIKADGFNREEQLMKLNFETYKKYQQQKIDLLKKSEKPEDKKQAKLLQGALDADIYIEKYNELQKTFEDILDIVSATTNKLAEMGVVSEDVGNALKEVLSTGAKLVSGDYVGAAISAISLLVDSFKAVREADSEFFKEQQEYANKILQSIELIQNASKNIGQFDYSSVRQQMVQIYKIGVDSYLMAERFKNLPEGKMTKNFTDLYNAEGGIGVASQMVTNLEKQIDRLNEKLALGALGPDQTKEVIAQIETYNSLIDSINGTIQDLTGTSISDLSNALVDAFLAGEQGAEQWGEKVKDIMGNIVRQQLISQMIFKPVQEAVLSLMDLGMNGENGLDKNALLIFKEQITDLFKEISPAFEAANEALAELGLTTTDAGKKNEALPGGMTGAIQNITEETAGLIAGQFGAMRIDLKSVIMEMAKGQLIMDQGLSHLSRISANTEYNRKLEGMAADLNELLRVSKERL